MAQMVNNLPTMWETWILPLGWEDPLEKEIKHTPVFLPRDSMDRGAYSPWGHKESDLAERLTLS